MKNRPSTILLIIDAILAALFIVSIIYIYELRDIHVENAQSLSNASPVSTVISTSTSTIEPLSLLYATTPTEQELGLGQRASLPLNEGMLFVFQIPENYGFWMKDMQFPIDMIWMSSDFKITHIESDVSPDTYPESFYPGAQSSYVLETNAGYAKNNNLSVGETLDFVKNSLDNTQ